MIDAYGLPHATGENLIRWVLRSTLAKALYRDFLAAHSRRLVARRALLG